jgi:hypothetical protein
LVKHWPHIVWPSTSTVGSILNKPGLVKPRLKRRHVAARTRPFRACRGARSQAPVNGRRARDTARPQRRRTPTRSRHAPRPARSASGGLRLAQDIADRKSTMPMLANVLLRTRGKNQLLVAATISTSR